jgi:hypothetical protein
VTGPFPRVADGTLLLYRQFDVADDIDLDRAEALLAGAAARLHLAGERTGFLDLPERPLTVALGPKEVPLGADGRPVAAQAYIRLFAHGVASVRYEVALPPAADAAAIAALVRAASEQDALERGARAAAEDLCLRLAPALDGAHSHPVFETYAVVFVRSFEGGARAPHVSGPDLARILLGEPPTTALSEGSVEHATRVRFAYTEDDLCVIDWDTALVVEPSADRSVADVLELATAQLLEFRYYDALFEADLLKVTAHLSEKRRGMPWPASAHTAALVRRAHHMVVETADFVERVENAVRVVGDLYLARVYRAAVERFRVPAWQAGVLRRQQVAAEVAGLLRGEVNTRLGHVLEAGVVLLIVLEIALAFLHQG